MSITYLRNRVREMRHARTEAEYEALLENLAYYLNVIPTGERLTSARKQQVFTVLRQIGINANRRSRRK